MIERVKSIRRGRKRAKANRKRFTEGNVLMLPVKRDRQYQVWDEGRDAARGLCVLVSPAGAKSYRSTYYFPGSPKPHSRHLGRVGEITLEEAREKCRQDRRSARSGVDPRADDPAKSDSYAAVVEEYIKRVQVGSKKNAAKTANEARRVLLKLSAPTRRHDADQKGHDWHGRPIATIRPQEIQRLLELVRDGDAEKGMKPRPYLANSLYGRLCALFSWCAKPQIGKLKASPMIGIEKPFDGEQRRTRSWFKGTAGDEAIRALWRAADEIGKIEGAYLKLLLLTGKRKSPLAEMRWEHIDRSGWYWDPPKPAAKNKRLHGVPLPDLAQRILRPWKADGFAFPGDDEGHIYVNGSWLQAKIINASGIKDYFHHGVRHLVETKLAELRIPPHIRDLLLDHAPSRGSGAGYDHHAYRDETLAALETWAEYIERLVQPEGARLLR